MKQLFILSAVVISALLFMNFNQKTEIKPIPQNNKYEVPEDIQAIIDNNCKGCHVSDSKNEKGRKKLSWDKMEKGYKKHQIIAKLMDIQEVLEKGEMPPEKFLAKYPDKNISKEDSEKMHLWAKEMAEKMAKQLADTENNVLLSTNL